MRPVRPSSLALTLARLRRLGGAGGPTLAEAVASLGRSGRLVVFPLLAMLGMAPSPGLPLGAVCGSLIVWLALGCLLQRPQGALPDGLGRRRIPGSVLRAGLRQASASRASQSRAARPSPPAPDRRMAVAWSR